MKTFLQGLLCLFLISALNQPCQAKLSAKRKKTLVYYIVGASVITVAVLAGGGVLYCQRSRQFKQKALSDAPPEKQERDDMVPLTPAQHIDRVSIINAVQAPTTPYTPQSRPPLHPRTPRKNKQDLLPPHPKTPDNHRFARTILAGSALIHLSPEKLKVLAPKLTFGVPYSIKATPPHEQHARSRRISITLANAAQDHPYTDGGVLVPGMRRFRGSHMHPPDIGIKPQSGGFHRIRLPDSTKKALIAEALAPESNGSDSD
jgi:hypothetical protein